MALQNDEVNNDDTTSSKSTDKKTTKEKPATDIKIDLDGLSDRIVSLPIDASNYGNIYCNGKNIYYLKKSQVADKESHLLVYSLKDRKETDLGSYDDYVVSNDKQKLLLKKGHTFFITDLGTSPIKTDESIDLSNMQVMVDKHAEWQQIYNEAWRQMRDFFYSPTMNGADWQAVHDKYFPLVKYVGRREDLTYLIGEMIGELSSGHTYTGGGDEPKNIRVYTGLLGADFARDSSSGYFKIIKLLQGANWDENTPFSINRNRKVNAKFGDYIIAINGTPTNAVNDIYQLLLNQAGKTIEVTLNDKPSSNGAHTALVKPIATEENLYYYNWVQHNIAYVDSVSHGQVGYIHIPDMEEDGLDQFMKLLLAATQ